MRRMHSHNISQEFIMIRIALKAITTMLLLSLDMEPIQNLVTIGS